MMPFGSWDPLQPRNEGIDHARHDESRSRPGEHVMSTYEQKVADLVRSKAGLPDAPAIDLDAIAERWGVEVHYMDEDDAMRDGASGQFLLRNGRPVILINPLRAQTHQRFTFAHELGHFFMRHGPRARDTKAQLQKRDPVEFSANRFAAELLMPEDHVRDAVRSATPLYQMARQFGVSEEAMGYRLKNLGYRTLNV